ncbi:formate/nitrite transporter family protein [Croceicoccus mobilis]|uniref:Transporter (Formate/nitrite transporter family protein) n=1 Tax=Croceicoccus mobilis TaxID=1703339 RepID=A0A917DSJ9_9SPHN|nr:formate/nitrite transporter family protein [Croceicoccus mobilis]GGD62999.1 hypothetical protein GCM10010990_10560 [Croceicoccus mobilis]
MTRETAGDPRPSHAQTDQPETESSDAELEDLSRQDRSLVRRNEVPSARLVHEIVRQRGIEELERPFWSLTWSAIGAGFVIGLSPYAMAIIALKLGDAPLAPVWTSLGYALGFVLVIAGRMQLFTESTVTAFLPALTTPCVSNTLRTLRLWAIVFGGNLIGTFLFGLFIQFDLAHQAEIAAEVQHHSAMAIGHYMKAPFALGIPAGFMLAALVWSMTNLKGQEIFIIVAVTWMMAMANIAHSVVGSAEMWVVMLNGTITPTEGIFGFLLPAALGNLVGGAGLFAFLAHAQVKPEIEASHDGAADREER